jgi:hypothetical protein
LIKGGIDSLGCIASLGGTKNNTEYMEGDTNNTVYRAGDNNKSVYNNSIKCSGEEPDPEFVNF